MKKTIIIIFLLSLLLVSACTFAQPGTTEIPGFFKWIWHWLVAPYTLVLRFFLDIQMYAIPNSWFTYDLWFLLWIIWSLPVWWIAAIISVVTYIII